MERVRTLENTLVEFEAPTMAQILEMHPRPWGETNSAGEMALNKAGFAALSLILLVHEDCVDEDAAAVCGAKDDRKGFYLQLASAAGKFCEAHRPTDVDEKELSCVPGLPKGPLFLLMGLFKMTCEHRAARA